MTDRAVVDACADLVGAIGSECFPARFHAALGSLAAVDLSSVFRHDEGKGVQLLFAQGMPRSIMRGATGARTGRCCISPARPAPRR
jgi:hypothetical protein